MRASERIWARRGEALARTIAGRGSAALGIGVVTLGELLVWERFVKVVVGGVPLVRAMARVEPAGIPPSETPKTLFPTKMIGSFLPIPKWFSTLRRSSRPGFNVLDLQDFLNGWLARTLRARGRLRQLGRCGWESRARVSASNEAIPLGLTRLIWGVSPGRWVAETTGIAVMLRAGSRRDTDSGRERIFRQWHKW